MSRSVVGELLDPATGTSSDGRGPIVRLENVHKWFGDNHVLRGISLELKPGEVQVIVGPSGSGKSTLLRCVNLLEIPSEGHVWFEGRDITDVRTNLNKVRARIGIVFQAFNLFPHKTVLQNITLALEKILGLSPRDAQERALTQLRHVGLKDKGGSYPNRLSGGQQQRVAIARALAMDPKLVLLDEVTSALDPELVSEVLDVVKRLASEGMTMMVVTHEMGFAREVGSRMIFIDEGMVVEAGSPREMFDDPKTDRLKRFLAKML